MTRYGNEGFAVHGKPAGLVKTMTFRIAGQRFTALNGGPLFKPSAAVSFVVHCETQAEVDHYWARLGEGGDVAAQQCRWLKDRFGLSWQVVPTAPGGAPPRIRWGLAPLDRVAPGSRAP